MRSSSYNFPYSCKKSTNSQVNIQTLQFPNMLITDSEQIDSFAPSDYHTLKSRISNRQRFTFKPKGK